ncbi:TPA: hypothetical protein PN979_003140 [Escherichia coli]|uniref:Cyanophage baseplate Pam3 plug gp18 domain-containing protein n=1 Tax=Escherichia coli O8 TaxID=1010796 RepID=A0A9P2I5J7_ECOLX|nr:hypothetical protein [Escherichia coli]EFO2014024.1 hypothetical protein [Escherichia coli O8]EEV4189237.1 hypothetical protein [Escherichia coli]EEW1653545.1 hypothetical protein [Escherichia coli]EEX5835125.1 hypothetical protein [Escherichia coli]EFA3940453.1 hypothetical protein [Escherichia coli]
MITIPLNSEPNQSLSILLDGIDHKLTIKEAGGLMMITIERDGKTIISNTRLLPKTLIIPYQYCESGNFVFLTENDEVPYYTRLDRQILIYVTASEMEAYRNE